MSLTFFMIPDFLLLNVVYLRSLLSINSILILTLPRVFFPGLGPGVEGLPTEPSQESGSSSSDSVFPNVLLNALSSAAAVGIKPAATWDLFILLLEDPSRSIDRLKVYEFSKLLPETRISLERRTIKFPGFHIYGLNSVWSVFGIQLFTVRLPRNRQCQSAFERNIYMSIALLYFAFQGR